MQLDKAIQERYSCKKFSTKKPNWRTIIECIDSARYAPMAGNAYSLKFILVDKPEIIQRLAEASQQDFFKGVHYAVVAVSNPTITKNSFPEKAEKYLRQQAGAGIQNFLLKITEAGLATCWIGHFVDDQIKHTLGIPDSMEVEAFFPIGYEFKKPKTRKDKISLDGILYFNSYGKKNMIEDKGLNA